jgi:hypothetical protein
VNKLALESFLQRVEGMSVADLKVIRAEFVKRIAKGEKFLGDSDIDLMAVGSLDQLISRKEMDEAEAGMTPEQLRALDRERLQKIGGLGAQYAERFLKNNGSPWAPARKHREVAKPAPEVESAPVEATPEEHERGQAAYERLDPHYQRRHQPIKD